MKAEIFFAQQHFLAFFEDSGPDYILWMKCCWFYHIFVFHILSPFCLKKLPLCPSILTPLGFCFEFSSIYVMLRSVLPFHSVYNLAVSVVPAAISYLSNSLFRERNTSVFLNTDPGVKSFFGLLMFCGRILC